MAKRTPPPGKTPEELLKQLEAASSPDNWETYKCKLVTPMYGGGVKAGEVDKEMPIRATEIRGQLRFWWRIACGPFSASKDISASQEMFKRETEIWGGIGADKPEASKVEVMVINVFKPALEAAFEYQKDQENPGQYKKTPRPKSWADGYALFPTQGELSQDKRTIKPEPNELAKPSEDCSSVDFILKIRLNEQLSETQREEVTQALRWWASFGGVGARTRRGLGAIWVQQLTPVSDSEVKKKGGILKPLTTPSDAMAAWRTSVSRLKDFRQKLNLARNDPACGSRSPAGRSLWPEAGTIRTLSGQCLPKHATRLVTVDGFPRAVFGLPIVFKFKDEAGNNVYGAARQAYDPDVHVLEPANLSLKEEDKRDRMASPLILRPYWNGSMWQPAALLLPGWEAALKQPLKFKGRIYPVTPGKPSQPSHWPDITTKQATMAYGIKPMRKPAGVLRATDPLSAFMDYFEKGE